MRIFNREMRLSAVVMGLLALAAVVAPLAWDAWKNRAQITVEVNSIATVTSNDHRIRELEFRYNGLPIEHLEQIVITVANTGRVPIVLTDFIRPISIQIGESALLDARILSTNPRGVSAVTEISNNRIILRPELLNPDDSVQIAVLSSDRKPAVIAVARIKGVRSLDVVGVGQKIPRSRDYPALALLLLFGGVFGLMARTFARIPRMRTAAIELVKNQKSPLINASSRDEAKQAASGLSILLDEESRPKLFAWIDYVQWPLDKAGVTKFSNELLTSLDVRSSSFATVFAAIISIVMITLGVLGFLGLWQPNQ